MAAKTKGKKPAPEKLGLKTKPLSVGAARTSPRAPWAKGVKRPEACKSLTDVRLAIDAYDDILLPLLAQRLKLVMSAARFKPSVTGVVKKDRVEQIVVRVRQAAKALGVSPDCLEYTYRHLITAYTREEQRNWPRIHKGAPHRKNSRR